MIHDATLKHACHTATILGIQRSERVLLITVTGKIDSSTAPTINGEVRRACRTTPPALVIDLTDVTSIAAAGLALLLDISQHTHAAGIDLHLVTPEHVLRVLSLTDPTHAFRIHGTAHEAVATFRARQRRTVPGQNPITFWPSADVDAGTSRH